MIYPKQKVKQFYKLSLDYYLMKMKRFSIKSSNNRASWSVIIYLKL